MVLTVRGLVTFYFFIFLGIERVIFTDGDLYKRYDLMLRVESLFALEIMIVNCGV